MDNPISAVFLDRDGTINVQSPDKYVNRWQDLELLPGAAKAISRINDAGIPVYVVTNQAGISHGFMEESALTLIHSQLHHLLWREAKAYVDQIYYCPHATGCECRKPLPGMLLTAAKQHQIDLTQAVMVGDMETDVEVGRAVGALGIRIGEDITGTAATFVVPDLEAAVDLIL